jgi:capsular exopolysaccharide synthesis family protein
MIFDFMQQPLYRAATSLVIDIQPSKVKTLEALDVYERSAIADQISIIKSTILAEQVFNALRLIQDPDFKNAKSPVAKLAGMVKVDAEKDKASKVLYIRVEDTDPLRASSIANTLAEVYIKWDVDSRNKSLKEAGQWLQDQLEDIRKKGEAAERAVNEYAQKNKIVTAADAGPKQEGLLESLKQKKSEIELQLAEAARRYRDKHPTMIALRASLDEVNKNIVLETQNLLDLKEKMVEYNILRKEVDSIHQVYSAMLQRSKEVGVSEKIEASGIRVLDKAYPPAKPFKPNTKQDVLTSIAISLFCGCGLAYFIEYLDSSMRSAEDVSSYLDLPFLGYMPPCDKEAKTDREKNLICLQKGPSPISESFRALRTSILFSFPEDKPLRSIIVTSSLPQEGKTFLSVNLALIFCQLNERVLLVDADMRKPKVNKSFNFELKPGLSTILTGNIDFEKALKPTYIPNLTVITSGTIPPNPSELLHSEKLALFFEEAERKFDRVIFDAPPLLMAADSALIANKADGVVFVIKGGATRLPDLVLSKKKLIDAKASVIGAVVNNLEPEARDHYYYYHYSYKEDKEKKS